MIVRQHSVAILLYLKDDAIVWTDSRLHGIYHIRFAEAETDAETDAKAEP